MIHAAVTAFWCIACIAMMGLPWPFFFWPVAFYLGREVAQAEYRYIEAHGGKRSLCPWWCGFLPQAWTAKSLWTSCSLSPSPSLSQLCLSSLNQRHKRKEFYNAFNV